MLQVVSPSATPEEVAAIVAAIEACTAADRAAVVVDTGAAADGLDAWVRGARLGARGAGLQRGPWRLSGRIGRRARV